jgi:hypothetical protein
MCGAVRAASSDAPLIRGDERGDDVGRVGIAVVNVRERVGESTQPPVEQLMMAAAICPARLVRSSGVAASAAGTAVVSTFRVMLSLRTRTDPGGVAKVSWPRPSSCRAAPRRCCCAW